MYLYVLVYYFFFGVFGVFVTNKQTKQKTQQITRVYNCTIAAQKQKRKENDKMCVVR